MADYDARFNRLVLSAADLKSLTSGQKPGEPWPDALIEDYLNILRDLVELIEIIDQNAAELIRLISEVKQTQFSDSSRVSVLYGLIQFVQKKIAQKQNGLLWKDQGVDLAARGDALNIDFVGAGVTASYSSETITVTVPGGGGGGSMAETEIDFGTTPVQGKKFTIVDAGVSPTSKILVLPSGNVATGRVGDDWEWDSIVFAAKPGTGNFGLTAYASGRIKGRRKIFYSVG